MFKIIATLKYLEALLARASAAVACASVYVNDVNARVIGAALNAAAQDIVLTAGNRENVRFTHNQCVEEISGKLRADINAAYKAHTDALQALDRTTDAAVAPHNEKLNALHARRDVLRARLAEVS